MSEVNLTLTAKPFTVSTRVKWAQNATILTYHALRSGEVQNAPRLAHGFRSLRLVEKLDPIQLCHICGYKRWIQGRVTFHSNPSNRVSSPLFKSLQIFVEYSCRKFQLSLSNLYRISGYTWMRIVSLNYVIIMFV